jgi:iron complex outermembrane recepter protein
MVFNRASASRANKLSGTNRPSVRALPERTRLAKSISAAIVASSVAAAPVYAEGFLEEVIVTATKRQESVQDVPLAITALTGDFTKAINLNDVKDLISFTPGISGNSQDSFIDAVSVRGIRTQDFGVGGDPSAALFKNDLYEGRNGSAVTSLYDVERSEVLRGPQGFLFGRNSIGGAISVHTRKAEIDENVSGYVDLDVAERDHIVFEGAVNVPVNDSFAVRVAGYYSQEDGFVDNFFDGGDLIEHDKKGIRFSSTFENDNLTINAMVEYEEREQSGSVYRAVETGDIWNTFAGVFAGADVRGNVEDTDSDQSLGDNDNADILTFGARIDYDLGWATVTSNTGYKDHDFFYTEDYDGTPLTINNYQQDQEGDYFQQELRLTSNNDGPLSWYAGVSYYEEDIDVTFTNSGAEDNFCNYYGNAYYPGNGITDCASLYAYYGSPFTASSDGLLTEPGRIRGEYSGWAVYVDLNYAINEQFDIGVGVRHTDDDKDFNINVPTPESQYAPLFAYGFTTDGDIETSDSWSDTQIRVIGRYTPTVDHMFFASYTEGFKSGGFGSFALNDGNGDRVPCCTTDVSQASGVRSRSFQPEKVESYEIGYKGSIINGSTDVSLSGFIYDYKDLQISFFDVGSGANTVENVGQVDGAGIEGSIITHFNENWNLYVAASWLDTEAKGVQEVCDGPTPDSCEGSTLFWAPEWTGAAVLNANFPFRNGTITGSFEAFWESERGGGWGGFPETMIDSNIETAIRVGYESSNNWTVGFYVENLTDEFTYDGLNNNGGILPSHFFGHRRPRTFGGTFGYEWN